MKKIIILLILLVSIKLNAQVGIDSINNKTDSFYTFVRNWVGSPYRVGGVSIRGVDCSGFSLVLYQTVFKITLPRIAKEQYKKTNRVKQDELTVGDLVFFRTRSRSGWHVGVYLFNGYFVHSENKRTGVKIDNLLQGYYKKTYFGGGRVGLTSTKINKDILYNQFRDYIEWISLNKVK